VISATRYLPEADWGLVVTKDQNEAYAPLQQLSDLLVIVMFILSVVIIFVAFYLARYLNEPILALAATADKIRGGDLKQRAPVLSSDEIGRLASNFNAMVDNVEKVDQMKSEFVLLASHQLRTPATAVKGFISMLLDGYKGKVTPIHRQLLNAAYEENERQISVINSILDVARMEAGEMVLERATHDLSKVAEASAAAQIPAAKQRNQTIAVKVPKAPVMNWIDAEKLQLVVDNLIHNATKYSGAGTTITVEVRRGRGQESITVSDSGIGIAKKDMVRLFKRFSRISGPETANIQGAGLGLYLADRLVKMHGGKIKVISEVGKGTSFSIVLPITTKEDRTNGSSSSS
jgi:two-component system, sensor histidine kinase ChiS